MVGFALAINLHLLLQTVQFESPIGPADSERLERGRERERACGSHKTLLGT